MAMLDSQGVSKYMPRGFVEMEAPLSPVVPPWRG